jgi:hypothetical protein
MSIHAIADLYTDMHVCYDAHAQTYLIMLEYSQRSRDGYLAPSKHTDQCCPATLHICNYNIIMGNDAN